MSSIRELPFDSGVLAQIGFVEKSVKGIPVDETAGAKLILRGILRNRFENLSADFGEYFVTVGYVDLPLFPKEKDSKQKLKRVIIAVRKTDNSTNPVEELKESYLFSVHDNGDELINPGIFDRKNNTPIFPNDPGYTSAILWAKRMHLVTEIFKRYLGGSECQGLVSDELPASTSKEDPIAQDYKMILKILGKFVPVTPCE